MIGSVRIPSRTGKHISHIENPKFVTFWDTLMIKALRSYPLPLELNGRRNCLKKSFQKVLFFLNGRRPLFNSLSSWGPNWSSVRQNSTPLYRFPFLRRREVWGTVRWVSDKAASKVAETPSMILSQPPLRFW